MVLLVFHQMYALIFNYTFYRTWKKETNTACSWTGFKIWKVGGKDK